MPKSRPILFSGPMVQAILREIEQPGTGKTQTRRVVKHIPALGSPEHWCHRVDEKLGSEWLNHVGDYRRYCPYGQPGDMLYVKEHFRLRSQYDHLPPSQCDGAMVYYEVDETSIVADGRFRHARFMPRWASRLTLRLTDVRVERVQSISEADAFAEGIAAIDGSFDDRDIIDMASMTGMPVDDGRTTFALLWDSINSARGYGWDKDPWTWALTFEVVR
ncbi:MAG: hypothetical protein ACYTBJ_02215 [Planctomycetota bacterium]|jgi:hypothetical protein